MKMLRVILVLGLALCIPVLLFSQVSLKKDSLNNEKDSTDEFGLIIKDVKFNDDFTYTENDSLLPMCFPFPIDPQFIGGQDSLYAYLSRSISYPDSAKVLNISGTVYISFIIEKDGSISNVDILRGIGGGCDEAALKSVKNMPNWESQSYATSMVIPIRFSIPQKKINSVIEMILPQI